jgi:hypothetical protein
MYIHLMEGTATPEKAEQAADTLLTLMPAAGHMVHMPAHIYQRVAAMPTQSRATSWRSSPTRTTSASAGRRALYPMAYYPHNIHFLWFAQRRTGRAGWRSSRRGSWLENR